MNNIINKIENKKVKEKITPIIPKDASSLIILRNTRKSIKVLMGRRPDNSRFMPGFYVFPGGALEKIDYYISCSSSLHKSISLKQINSKNISHSIALALAAIRETAEETGLMLASKKNTISSSKNLIDTSWQNFKNYNCEPSLDKLFYLGRAVTPAFLKIRFNARFFVAYEKDFLGKVKTNDELEELSWIKLEDIKNFICADVTEFMIKELLKLNGNISKLNSANRKKPMFTWRNRKRLITWS